MLCGGSSLDFCLTLFLATCIGGASSTQFTESYNDFAHNHDEMQLNYAHQYFVSDVPSGVHILHREQRLGDRISGSYAHVEPSGEVRSVHYEVSGRRGYRAVVVQRSLHSRVHQLLNFERRQPAVALPLAQLS